MMRIYVTCIVLAFSLHSTAQSTDLEKSIQCGNWQLDFINFERLDTVDHVIGDTVVLSKVPKRLKFKKQRPSRFKADGTVDVPQTPPFSCGTVSTFEALWYLKWREYATWSIEQIDDKTLLNYKTFTLQLLDSKRKQFTFVITKSQKDES